MYELVKIKIPNYTEISVKILWNKFKEDEEVLKYFPDYSEAQIPEKKFLIDILSIIKYEYNKKS